MSLAALVLLAAAGCSHAGPATPAKPSAPAPTTRPSATPAAPTPPTPVAPAPVAGVAAEGLVTDAPPGIVAAAGDTWKPVDAGETLATVEMRLVRGLEGIEDQARTLQGALTPTPAAGVDVASLPPGTWLHGAVPVTKTELVPFAVSEDRRVLVLDSDRDGVLETSERLTAPQAWGGLSWFAGTLAVRQMQAGHAIQTSLPVKVGVMTQAPRMACRIDGRREGTAQIGGKTLRLAIVDHTFRGWFSHPSIDSLMVDVDGDGAFDSTPDSAERYRLGDAFPAGSIDAIVTFVGPFGSSLTIARAKKPAIRKASLRIGSPAPTFEATNLDGKPVKLASLKGKWVLIDFWATWCGPCRNELPHLLALRKRHPDVVILGVSGDDTAAPIGPFTKAQGMDWQQIHAEARAVMRQYRVASFPTSFLVAPDGTIAARDLRGPSVSDQVERIKAQFKGRG